MDGNIHQRKELKELEKLLELLDKRAAEVRERISYLKKKSQSEEEEESEVIFLRETSLGEKNKYVLNALARSGIYTLQQLQDHAEGYTSILGIGKEGEMRIDALMRNADEEKAKVLRNREAVLRNNHVVLAVDSTILPAQSELTKRGIVTLHDMYDKTLKTSFTDLPWAVERRFRKYINLYK